MDAFNSINWDALFGYAIHDCSCLILFGTAAMMGLAAAVRLWMTDRRPL